MMNKERLLLLADFLEKMPEERFDYVSWVGYGWQGKPDLSCGTTACALGWATTIPELRDAGLRLVKVYSRYDGSRSHTFVTSVEYPETYDAIDGNRYSIMAAKEVFGINSLEANSLFVPDTFMHEESTAKDIAELIRYFVANETMNGFVSDMTVSNPMKEKDFLDAY